jgi:hypothetical protein
LKASCARRFTSSSFATWSVTVFISSPPLFDVAPKIRQQRVWVSETIRLLGAPRVPMIALARLVVVSQHASSIDDKCQSILEPVGRSTSWPRQTPNDNLDEHTGVKHMPFVDQQLDFHVGVNNNAMRCCQ